jgi:splicing suppressor protein 51
VYHSFCPLPFLSPVPRASTPETIAEQRENERIYRQLLAEGALAVLLPTEDLQNPCLTSLVSQILSELVIGNIIANKASQPWLLFEGLSILAKMIQEEPRVKVAGRAGSKPTMRNHSCRNAGGLAQSVFLSTLRWIFLIFAAIRFFVTSLVMSSSLPSRQGRGSKGRPQLTSHSTKLDDTDVDKVPVVSFRIWTCASNLIEMEKRMPWLVASLSMLQLGLLSGPGRIANPDGIIDR